MLRRAFLTRLCVLGLLGPRLTEAAVKGTLPPAGIEFTYRLLFGGHEVGQQRTYIRSHDELDQVVIEHRINAEVRILFATAYRLDHASVEIWDGFQLSSVTSDTRENDASYAVQGKRTQDGFELQQTEGQLLVDKELVTTDSFWIAAALRSPQVLNTRTGDIATPSVEQLDGNRWHLRADFAHGPIEASMRFDGEFLAEAEVNENGHELQIIRMTA